jgi:hypothetical protein
MSAVGLFDLLLDLTHVVQDFDEGFGVFIMLNIKVGISDEHSDMIIFLAINKREHLIQIDQNRSRTVLTALNPRRHVTPFRVMMVWDNNTPPWFARRPCTLIS